MRICLRFGTDGWYIVTKRLDSFVFFLFSIGSSLQISLLRELFELASPGYLSQEGVTWRLDFLFKYFLRRVCSEKSKSISFDETFFHTLTLPLSILTNGVGSWLEAFLWLLIDHQLIDTISIDWYWSIDCFFPSIGYVPVSPFFSYSVLVEKLHYICIRNGGSLSCILALSTHEHRRWTLLSRHLLVRRLLLFQQNNG